MPVTQTHPEYDLHAPEWQRTEDAAIGSPALKRKPAEYLPESYRTTEPERYADFCRRAYYVNFTGRTEKVLLGMVFRKPAKYEMPEAMEAYLESVDGAGQSLEQMAKEALLQRLRKSRCVFLADHTADRNDLDRGQQRDIEARPIGLMYHAENLINWKFDTVRGRRLLVLAVLVEWVNVSEDKFGHQYERQFRVLELVDGKYTQQLYDSSFTPTGVPVTPLQKGGKAFDYIPLHGVRDLEVAPLQPIAEINLAYYWNTAKVEDQVDVTGNPNLHIDVGQTSLEEWQAANGNTFKLGGRIGTLTKGGRLDIVQAAERPLVRVIRQDKLEELANIGAAIVQKGGQAETAEAVKTRAGEGTSQLDMVVSDLSEDIEAMLESIARFAGVNADEVFYKLNTDFFATGLTAQELDIIVKNQILYGPTAALDMIRKGRIELSSDMTNEQLLQDAASALMND